MPFGFLGWQSNRNYEIKQVNCATKSRAEWIAPSVMSKCSIWMFFAITLLSFLIGIYAWYERDAESSAEAVRLRWQEFNADGGVKAISIRCTSSARHIVKEKKFLASAIISLREKLCGVARACNHRRISISVLRHTPNIYQSHCVKRERRIVLQTTDDWMEIENTSNWLTIVDSRAPDYLKRLQVRCKFIVLCGTSLRFSFVINVISGVVHRVLFFSVVCECGLYWSFQW